MFMVILLFSRQIFSLVIKFPCACFGIFSLLGLYDVIIKLVLNFPYLAGNAEFDCRHYYLLFLVIKCRRDEFLTINHYKSE